MLVLAHPVVCSLRWQENEGISYLRHVPKYYTQIIVEYRYRIPLLFETRFAPEHKCYQPARRASCHVCSCLDLAQIPCKSAKCHFVDYTPLNFPHSVIHIVEKIINTTTLL